MVSLTTLFLAATINHSLPVGLLESLCYVESKHNVNAVHRDDGNSDSLGVCQIKYRTAQYMGFKGTRQQLMLPTVNIYYAGKYLRHQLNRYGSIERAVIAYNLGHAGRLTSTKYQVRVYEQWRHYECSARYPDYRF
jgi:soluble lytic murein transglycosylase-like protein